jgi:5'-nucleotidase
VRDSRLILLTNDDGIDAPGLNHLAETLRPFGRLFVVAPQTERSGASHSLTLGQPIKVQELGQDRFAIDGTPVDCVLYALRRFLPRPPTWVVSGANRGSNLGDDTLYSGTVGAASIAALHGFCSFAVSLDGTCGKLHWESAAYALENLLKGPYDWDAFQGRVININVPNVPIKELRGFKAATLGRRFYCSRIEHDLNDSSLTWYAKEDVMHDRLPATDCTAVEEGYVALSVLAPSLFDEEGQERLVRTLQKGGVQ